MLAAADQGHYRNCLKCGCCGVLREILPEVYAFRPNRESLGGTAYLIKHPAGNCLIDCPAPEQLEGFTESVRWLIVTHRSAIGTPAASQGCLAKAQAALQCEIIIHEQEAYLTPHLAVTPWHTDWPLAPGLNLIWTPGHSPGSCCVFLDRADGILFSGRHILPTLQGELGPQRQTKTFHWRRQLQSCLKLLDVIPAPAPAWLCPGGNTGYLRGEKCVAGARSRLAAQAPAWIAAAVLPDLPVL